MRSLLLVSFLLAPLTAQPVVSWSGPTMRLASASVSPLPGGWQLSLVMDDDNGNASLPSSFRRWWHCEITGLDPAVPELLQVQVSNAGYTDIILPVWSQRAPGGSYGPYARLPVSATPTHSGTTHSFSFVAPVGVSSIRLAKYFPYTEADKDQFVAGLVGHPFVTSVSVLGSSTQGRPITRLGITDPAVPVSGKRLVWIHAGIHPAETTSYWVVEGLVGFLLSGDPRASVLLRDLVFEIFPMVNPDGVTLGNYRTNASSVNLESQWAAPYNSLEPEIVALRGRIESLMGTPGAPGPLPLGVLLNLHASHGAAFPFHFRHVANPSFSLPGSPTGVIPAVNQLESQWIAAFRARSPFVNLGSTASSTCGAPSRPFVECMLHDRWSSDPLWTSGPAPQAPVMAITFEGTYGPGPAGVTWNEPDDWRQVGRELALALGDFFGSFPDVTLSPAGPPCAAALGFTQTVSSTPGGPVLALTLSGVPTGSGAWLVAGLTPAFIPLSCPLLVQPDLVLPMAPAAPGTASLSAPLAPGLSFTVNVQAAVVGAAASPMAILLSDAFQLQVLE